MQGQGAAVEICYSTREAIKGALDYKETARANQLIDDANEAASRDVEALCHRIFYPLTATRHFDWPNRQTAKPWRLWLDANELLSVTSISSGGQDLGANYFLYPDDGPPYTRIELDLDTSASFGRGRSHQKDITIEGVFGAHDAEATVGVTEDGFDDAVTAFEVSNSSRIGVGSLIRVDDERMLVVNKTMADTSQVLLAPLAASMADNQLAVTSGLGYHVDEILLLDGERMLIVDIAGNTLVVKRAWDGSTLGAHTGSSLYAPRTLSVERGAAGTLASAHDGETLVRRHTPPSLVAQLTKAQAIDNVLQDSAGWARTSGSSELQREASGRGLTRLRDKVYAAHGRKARMR